MNFYEKNEETEQRKRYGIHVLSPPNSLKKDFQTFFSFFASRGDSDYLCTMACGNYWLPNDLQGNCFLSHENVYTIVKDLNVISEKTFNFESILKRHSLVRVKKPCS